MTQENFKLPTRTKVLAIMSILVLFFLVGLASLSRVSQQTNNNSWWQNLKIWQLTTHFNISPKADKIKEFKLDTEIFSSPKYGSLENAYEPPQQLPLAGNPNPFLASPAH